MKIRDTKIIDGDEWVCVCRSTDVKEHWGFRVDLDIEHDVALFRIDNTVYAVSNICPHEKRPLISTGYVENGEIMCPVHCWIFDIRTGKKIREHEDSPVKMEGGRGLPTYTVLEMDGWVWLRL